MRTTANIKVAKRLRKVMTKPETWLWQRLRTRAPDQVVFRRQHPELGYVLDFYCTAARLAVEVDGEIHTRDHKRLSDAARDARLTA